MDPINRRLVVLEVTLDAWAWFGKQPIFYFGTTAFSYQRNLAFSELPDANISVDLCTTMSVESFDNITRDVSGTTRTPSSEGPARLREIQVYILGN